MNLAAIVILFLPTDDVARDQVDVIELSHVYDDCGRLTIRQWIFWQDDKVRAWRLVKGNQAVTRERGEYRLLWHDGELLRDVRAASYRETHCQYDPEVYDRERTPKERRRELTKQQ